MPRTGLGIRAKRLLTRTIRPFDLLTKGRNTYYRESKKVLFHYVIDFSLPPDIYDAYLS